MLFAAVLGSFAEVSACILFSGQLPTGRSVEPEVQVKQQQTTLSGDVDYSFSFKSLFEGKGLHFMLKTYNF